MKKQNSLETAIEDLFEEVSDALFGNERKDALAQYARKHGFRFNKKVGFGKIDNEIKTFELFSDRKKKRIRNAQTKEEAAVEGTLRLFDYRADGHFGKKNTTVALVKSPAFELPTFLIRPKRTTERITDLFVHQDVLIDRYPSFKKQFILKGDDFNALHFLLTDRLVDLLLQRPEIWVEGRGDYLLLYEKNRQIEAGQLAAFHEFAVEVARVLLYDQSNEFV